MTLFRRAILIFGTAATISLRQLGLYESDSPEVMPEPVVHVQFLPTRPDGWDPREVVGIGTRDHIIAWSLPRGEYPEDIYRTPN